MLSQRHGTGQPATLDQSAAVEIPDHAPGATVVQLGIEHGAARAWLIVVRRGVSL